MITYGDSRYKMSAAYLAPGEKPDYLWGGEDYTLTDIDIEMLKAGYRINFFVNGEYGCCLDYKSEEKRI